MYAWAALKSEQRGKALLLRKRVKFRPLSHDSFRPMFPQLAGAYLRLRIQFAQRTELSI